MELCGRDADDRDGPVVDSDRLSDAVGIGTERARPKLKTQNRHRRGLKPVVLGSNQTTQGRSYAERVKVVAGDDVSSATRWSRSGIECHLAEAIGGQRLKGRLPVAQVAIMCVRMRQDWRV